MRRGWLGCMGSRGVDACFSGFHFLTFICDHLRSGLFQMTRVLIFGPKGGVFGAGASPPTELYVPRWSIDLWVHWATLNSGGFLGGEGGLETHEGLGAEGQGGRTHLSTPILTEARSPCTPDTLDFSCLKCPCQLSPKESMSCDQPGAY